LLNIHRTVQQGQQINNDKYSEKYKIQNTQHAVQIKGIHSELTTINREQNMEEEKMVAGASHYLLSPGSG